LHIGICTAGSYLRLNFVYKILLLKTCIILLKNNKIINSYIKLPTVQIPICTAGSYLSLNFVHKILSLKTCIILLKNNKIINSYIKLPTVQIPNNW